MNTLPEHRKIVHGRTFPCTYDQSSMTPIEGPYRHQSRLATVVYWVVCMGSFASIGIMLAWRG